MPRITEMDIVQTDLDTLNIFFNYNNSSYLDSLLQYLYECDIYIVKGKYLKV